MLYPKVAGLYEIEMKRKRLVNYEAKITIGSGRWR
jgi:hypothetical protein